MNASRPAAFLSYAHAVDHDGTVTAFRERLERELHVVSGLPITIFQDDRDIGWGEAWRERLERSIDESTFFLPLLTPGYFKSEPCREEAIRFLELERRLGRTDLILPVYFVDTPLLNDESLWSKHELASVFARRQWFDWRDLRTEPLESPGVRRMMARLAMAFRGALERVEGTGGPAAAPSPVPRDPARHPEPRPRETGVRDPEFRVNSADPTAFRTIADAVAAARPGAVIAVAPGLYRETLVIEKPVHLRGDGAREDVVIVGRHETPLTWRALVGRIENLTIRGEANLDALCVAIAGGRLELEGCDIFGGTGGCVGVLRGADPRIRRNRIHDCDGPGLVFLHEASGIVEDNHIHDTDPGVSTYAGSRPTVSRNRIEHNRTAGIVVAPEGAGRFEDNDLAGNAEYGAYVDSGAGPVFVENRITGHALAGIHVTADGSGSFRGNCLSGNGAPQLSVHPDARRVVQLAGNEER